jgi:type IV pilus assembly protein PilO
MAINFNQIAEDFKHTNWKDPGTWTIAPKIVVLIAVLVLIPVGGYFLVWQGQIDELEQGLAQEETLKKDYLAKKTQAINLDLHKQQLREIDTQFGALLKQLPNKSQMDALLVDINQSGLSRGLQFELFKPDATESAKEFYSELPIKVKVIGTYHDMGAFAADVGQLPRIVTLNDVTIEAGKDGNLAMEVTARTFRYLDEEEVSAQRKAAAAKKAPAAAPKKAATGGHGAPPG